MAGYSSRSLVDKLGIKPETTIVLLGGPKDYGAMLGPLPQGASIAAGLPRAARFIHLFARCRTELEATLPRAERVLADAGTLWVSWPKKVSRLPSDITENVVRDVALPLGLVDVKVCAVDETWSGLKLMRRKELRASISRHL